MYSTPPFTPLVPDVPLEPDVPDVPFVPEVPELPELPELPEEPSLPDVPDVPDVPFIPEVPELPDVPDVPDVPDLLENFTSPLPVSYAKIKSISPEPVSGILPLCRCKLPVKAVDPVMYISLFALPERASIILSTCSARMTLPLTIPDVLIVEAINIFLLRIIP